ncbi:hypothetical protein B0O99DRAFT_180598 [Bisporella sp. PMI_857]|nr:hypothetical protein B0O99DRAFT_180598 [Bisporella sp. PMI_857]
MAFCTFYRCLRNRLGAALQAYEDIIDDGYDTKFGLYIKVVVQAAPQAVKGFHMKHGNQHFVT